MTPVECWYACAIGALFILLGVWFVDMGYARGSWFLQALGVIGCILLGFGLIVIAIGRWIGG